MSETLNPHTPHPLDVLDRIEAKRRHPAGRRRDPIRTASDFHDEIDAPTGRALPRTIPARTSCAPAPAPHPIPDRSPLRAGEASGLLTITALLILGALLPILAVTR